MVSSSLAKRSKSSRRWLAEREADPYVKAARASGFRLRAVYKPEEIERTDMASDILPMDAIPDVEFVQGDF